MPGRISVLYLHGFASSVHSSKATYLTKHFAERGIRVVTPDLNLPDFSTLTVTRMLDQAEAALGSLPSGPVAVIGSSLGGFVAIQLATRRPDRIRWLVLLAPALDFGHSTSRVDGPAGSHQADPLSAERIRPPGDLDLAAWKRAGKLNVFHYGYGRMMPIHYALYEDAARYNAMDANIPMPTLVFQGRRDTVVDPVIVERWAQRRLNVELLLLDDDHQLGGSLERIWIQMASFLSLP